MNEYMSYVNERLLIDKRLEQVSPGIGKLLSEHSRAVLVVKQTQQEFDAAFNVHIEKFTNKLKQDYSIRSRVNEWLNECYSFKRLIWLSQNWKIAPIAEPSHHVKTSKKINPAFMTGFLLFFKFKQRTSNIR